HRSPPLDLQPLFTPTPPPTPRLIPASKHASVWVARCAPDETITSYLPSSRLPMFRAICTLAGVSTSPSASACRIRSTVLDINVYVCRALGTLACELDGLTEMASAERQRLRQAASGAMPWRRWGPYLSERAWATVREDYSPFGQAWEFFPHEHARARVYRWNDDGLGGLGDDS